MKKTIIITAVAALLTSCGSSSTSSTDSNTTPTTTINVTNTSGGTSDITGTWALACVAGASGDSIISETFSGTNSHSEFKTGYTTTDGSCGGTATELWKKTGTFVINADATGVGWVNNTTVLVAAPTAQDGVTTLPATPSATQLLVTYTAVSGSTTSVVGNTNNVARIFDATGPTTYDLFDDGVNGLTGDIAFKATKQ